MDPKVLYSSWFIKYVYKIKINCTDFKNNNNNNYGSIIAIKLIHSEKIEEGTKDCPTH